MPSVFQKFGGIRPMAAKLDVPPSTIKSWHTKRVIPDWRRDSVLKAAERHGIALGIAELEDVQPDDPDFGADQMQAEMEGGHDPSSAPEWPLRSATKTAPNIHELAGAEADSPRPFAAGSADAASPSTSSRTSSPAAAGTARPSASNIRASSPGATATPRTADAA